MEAVVTAEDRSSRTKQAIGSLVGRLDRLLTFLDERQNDGFGLVIVVLSTIAFLFCFYSYGVFSNEGTFEPNWVCTVVILSIAPLQVIFAGLIHAKTLLRAVFSFVLLLSFLALCVSWYIYTRAQFWPAFRFFPLAATVLCVLVSIGMTYVIVARNLHSKLLQLRQEIYRNLFWTLMFFMALFFNITILLSFALAFDDQPLQRALSGAKRGPLANLQAFEVSLYSMSVFDPKEAKNTLLGISTGLSEPGAVKASSDLVAPAGELGWRFVFERGALSLASNDDMCKELTKVNLQDRSAFWNFCEVDKLRAAVAACRDPGNTSVVTIWAPGAEQATYHAVRLQALLKAAVSRCGSSSCGPSQIRIQPSFSSKPLGENEQWRRAFPGPEVADFELLEATLECSEPTAVENYALRLSRGRRLQLLDYIYFTTYTITTTGYGDIVPISGFAKFICSIANFFELFFVVIFFNCLVAIGGEKRDETGSAEVRS